MEKKIQDLTDNANQYNGRTEFCHNTITQSGHTSFKGGRNLKSQEKIYQPTASNWHLLPPCQ